jgi:hypothetical protein
MKTIERAAWGICVLLLASAFSATVAAPEVRPNSDQEVPPDPDVELAVLLDKQSYHVNEPIHLGIRIANTSKQPIWVDSLILFQFNVQVRIKDEQGQLVDYPGSRLRLMIARRLRATDFVRLEPGCFFGCLDATGDKVRLEQKGRYTVHVSYAHAGAGAEGRKLGLKAWSGVVVAPPIKIEVVQ